MNSQTHEVARLKALWDLGILDTGPEHVFDELTRFGARFLQMPTCLISLVDEHRQWFKSRVGVDIDQTPREIAFCDHVIQGQSVMIIPDATKDSRFCANPLVTDGMKIRFYAGAPITHMGQNIGTFCVLDIQPNYHFGDFQIDFLTQLAAITSEILRRDADSKDRQVVLI